MWQIKKEDEYVKNQMGPEKLDRFAKISERFLHNHKGEDICKMKINNCKREKVKECVK